MCDERERLIGYVYDECDPAERREIARHLEECGTCRIEISALRGVRQDLLAWEIEGGPAVWRPVAPPVVLPWYRQVPVWAMAAAATVMFAIGAAGGVVTQAFMADGASPVVITEAPTASPIRASAELTDVERRIVDRLRAELAAQMNAARTTAATPVNAAAANPDQLMQRVNSMVEQSEQRMLRHLFDSSNAWAASTTQSQTELRDIRRSVEKWMQESQGSGGGGGR